MTRNTISYKEYEERRRSNLANENLKSQELRIRQNELAETVANNMRNYGINIEKNQIQKLANDQLNDREAKKLTETIRSNLKTEEIRLAELAERTTNNQEKIKLEKQANEIKEMDTLLQAAKATGKSAAAILLSWITNNVNLSAFGGKNVLTQLFPTGSQGYSETLFSRSENDATAPAIESYNGQSYRNYNQRSQTYHGHRTRAKGKITISDARYINSRKNRRFEEENEIPEDFSQSYGPDGPLTSKGGKNEVISTKNASNEASRNGSKEGFTQTRANGEPSKSSSTSRVIYSPGAKGEEKVGPGIGLAFS